MTEELKKEAKEWCKSKNLTSSNVGYFTADYCEQSYLAGAEPREKRIAELEAENERLKGDLELWESGACRATNLDKCGVVKELETQIEKMKWHIVADGDLPEDRRNVYVVYLNGENLYEKTIASYRHKYWVFNGLRTECEVVAWYELPTWGK